MTGTVLMPLWLVIVLAISAVASAYHHVLLPFIRMYLRSRERRIHQRLENELSRKLPEYLKIRRKTRIEMFLNKTEVKQAIAEAVKDNQGTKELLEYKVHEYAKELTPGFYALFYFKIGYFLARSYIRLLYDVRIGKQPSAAVGRIPQSASVVLVGNHRSNLDVMILAYLAARTNMVSFAAGEWAKAWPLSVLLHMSGSYIIRRNEKLPLYRRILAIHLRELVKVKMPQGIFLEGGLTRDGGIQNLKLGLMNYILSALGEENVDDIVFIPVAFNYDQVPEDRTLIKHQDRGFQGRSAFYTSLSTFWSIVRVAYRKIQRDGSAFGKAVVSFGEPVSMSQWLAENGFDNLHFDGEQKRNLVAPVAEDLIATIKAMIPVLPVSIISTVFVDSCKSSLSELEVQNRASVVLQRFKQSDAVIAFTDSQSAKALAEGLETLLGRKVLVLENGYYSVNSDNVELLRYFYNTTRHYLDDTP